MTPSIIGDELLLNFVLICNFTCEITKLPWQPSVPLSVKIAMNFQNVMKMPGRKKSALKTT